MKPLQYIQTRDVARLLAITPTRVGQLVKEGKLSVAMRLGDGTPLFDPDVVQKFKAARIAVLIQETNNLKERT